MKTKIDKPQYRNRSNLNNNSYQSLLPFCCGAVAVHWLWFPAAPGVINTRHGRRIAPSGRTEEGQRGGWLWPLSHYSHFAIFSITPPPCAFYCSDVVDWPAEASTILHSLSISPFTKSTREPSYSSDSLFISIFSELFFTLYEVTHSKTKSRNRLKNNTKEQLCW